MMRSTSVLFREDLSPTPALAGATSYSYDTRNELLNETSARNGGYSNAFGYDGAENPTTFKGAPNTFNTDNQNVAFTFDGNGNTTTYKGTTLGFDPENRMTSFGTAMTEGYNGDGLRAWKNSASGRTYYVYDGDSPLLELNSTGIVTAVNVWSANGLLSRRTGTASVYYTFYPQGSVVQRLDANENILSASAYDAWGNLLVPNPNDPFGYEAQWGYYTDNETGLLLLTHRYYDPGQGRFVTRDPKGYSGGINLYGYVGNGVEERQDISGFDWSWIRKFFCCNPFNHRYCQKPPWQQRLDQLKYAVNTGCSYALPEIGGELISIAIDPNTPCSTLGLMMSDIRRDQINELSRGNPDWSFYNSLEITYERIHYAFVKRHCFGGK